MAEFDISLKKTLQNEGGYRNDVDDSGGETYKGISRKSWPNWTGWKIIDNCNGNIKNFPECLDANMNLQILIGEFYKDTFWQAISGDQIKDQDIANSIFDFSVNAGIYEAIKLSQKCLGITIDGVIGPETLDYLNNSDPKGFLPIYFCAKVGYRIDICKKRPKSKEYFYGWIKRDFDL